AAGHDQHEGGDAGHQRHRWPRGTAPPQGARQQRHGQRAQGEREQEERHHGVAPSSAASGSSGSNWSSLSRARRRRTKNRMASPPTSSRPGPNHSSQVVALTGGRYSTKSP